MEGIELTKDSTSKDLESLAMAIYSAIGLPITMRSKNKKGLRIENNKVLDSDYTGKYLEMALEKGEIVHGFADEGPYKGTPVIVSPIKDKNGEVVAVVGVVNLAGFIDLTRL